MLGNTTIARQARRDFRQNLGGVRQAFQNTLQSLLNITEAQFLQQARNAIRTLTGFLHFGTTIATRLVALARPDCAVSVTALCAPRLGMLSGLSRTSTTLGNAANYPRLLNWLYTQPLPNWYRSPPPTNATEREVWSMRAALLDVFVYDP